MLAESHKGVVLVGAFTAHGVDRLLSVVQAAAFNGAFSRPGAVEGYHIKFVSVEVNTGRIYPCEGAGLAAHIPHGDRPGDDIQPFKGGVDKRGLQPGVLVLHSYLKGVAGGAFSPEGGGKSLQSGLALVNAVGLVSKVTGGGAVRRSDLESVFAVISQPEAGILKWQGVKINGAVAVVGLGGEGVLVQPEQIAKVAVGNGSTEIGVSKIVPAGSHGDDIIGIICPEPELSGAFIVGN